MNLFRNMPLQRKLTLITLLTTGVVMVLACVALFIFQSVNFRETYVRDLESLANMFSDNSTAAVTFNDAKSAEEILAALRAKPRIVGAEIRLLDGTTLARYGRDEASLKLNMAGLAKATDHRFIKDYLVLTKSIDLDGKQIGTLRLWCNYRADYRALLQLYSAILLTVLCFSLGFSYMLSSRLQRIISGPMLKLADTARFVAENNDYTVRVEQLGRDEVGLLTEAFNRMLARVEAQDSQLRLSQQQFESLVNSINGIVWETDPFTLKTLFVSPQVEAILGYPRERWLQHPTFWQERRHPEDQERTAALLHNLIEVGKPFHLEYRMLHASGQVLWFQDNINILMQDGQPRLLRGVTLDITAQKLAQAKLAEAQKKLLETSRLAGMAEIAAGVLHNVGNVLNSVNVSVSLLQENVKKSQIQNFAKAANLLRDHAADTAAFLTHDPKGQRLPGYLIGLSDHVASEQLAWQNELDRLSKNIEHIKEIVAMQQNYARISGIMEVLNAQELVEDALRMNDAALGRHGVKVVREYQKTPLVTVDRHKVLQILINLIRNSKYAMDKADKSDRTLTVAIGAGGDGGVSIQVRDNGIGIPAENLTRIFQHGFTTKQEGHGFGLHSAANAAKELGGRLTAQSDGPGQGAVFILDLPAASPKTNGPLARQLQPAWHSPTSEI